MRKLLGTFTLLIAISTIAFSQVEDINQKFNREDAISHFRYLASDELKGRDPLRP